MIFIDDKRFLRVVSRKKIILTEIISPDGIRQYQIQSFDIKCNIRPCFRPQWVLHINYKH